ncbi:MAG: hypothetical protein WA790_06355 [Sulfitobacter sp.]
MAIVVGLVVGLFLLLGFHLLGIGLRNPRWLFVGFCLILALYKYGAQQHEQDIQDIGLIAGRSTDCTLNQVQTVVGNGRSEVIIGFRFSLRGFKPNHSDHILYGSFQSDRIIPAGQSWASCWDIDGLADVPTMQKNSLRWEAELTNVEFAD